MTSCTLISGNWRGAPGETVSVDSWSAVGEAGAVLSAADDTSASEITQTGSGGGALDDSGGGADGVTCRDAKK